MKDRPAESLQFDHLQAELFLQLLGKDPAQTRIRGFFEKHDPRKPDDSGRKGAYSRQLVQQWISEGRGIYVVINDGGDSKKEISGCRALFNEWDDQPRDWQLTAWQGLGMPAPTCQVDTGRQSIHTYWRLLQLIRREQFTSLQERLVAHGDSDNLIDPSRVMRLPGCPRGDCAREMVQLILTPPADGQPLQYDVHDLDARLPQLPAPEPAAAAPRQQPTAKARASTGENCDLPPRGMDQIREALNCIPRRQPGNGNYLAPMGDRDMLWGLVAAVQDAGGTIEQAIDLMEAHSPSEACKWPVEQVARSGNGSKTAATFWRIAKDNGFDARRHDLRQPAPEPPKGTPEQQAAWGQGDTPAEQPAEKQRQQRNSKAEGFTPRADTTARRRKRPMGHNKRMLCMERCIEVQARKERNSLRRRVRLLKVAHDLKLQSYIKAPDIAAKVLEAKAAATGNTYRPLSAADRAAMEKPVLRWALPELIPANDLTIIGGRPKVGKTRLAVAVAAAVLRAENLFDLPAPSERRKVVLITDDQSDADTEQMLSAAGIWDHDDLVWSQNFRLTETNIDALLKTIEANPGALVVIDSLRSIGRDMQHGENDPEIGAVLYDLKQAVMDAGGTLLLIHHCNKAMDLVGVEALSGHNAISGAANTVLTMHYLPNAQNQPNKGIPERRLVREGRSGSEMDIVITRACSSFRKVGPMDQWQEKAQQAQKLQKLTALQQDVLDALQDSGEWMTRRQVCELLGKEWTERGRKGEARKVGDALNRLVEVGAVESERAGTEATYRSTHEAQEDPVTTVPTSDSSASQCHESDRDSRDSCDNPEPVSRVSQKGGDTEKADGDSLARVSRQSQAHGRDDSQADLFPIASAPIGSGADVASYDDDPWWGPRPAVA
jgi:Fe2+ or Zn2+ uptake regulation protein